MLSAVVFVLLYCANVGEGHVALVFPPARKYDLDFLDSSRTKAPCGMPKGKLILVWVRFYIICESSNVTDY